MDKKALQIVINTYNDDEMYHYIRVGSMFSTAKARTVGFLHNFSDFKKLEELDFDDEVIHAISLLTKASKSVDNEALLEIAKNDLAWEVYIADCLDQLSFLGAEDQNVGIAISKNILLLKDYRKQYEEASKIRQESEGN